MKNKLSGKKIFLSLALSCFCFKSNSKTITISKTEIEEDNKTSFEKFSERLKINYFSIFTTPPYRDIRHGKWKNAAIAPSMGLDPGEEHSNHDSWPTNIWNQISFNYNYGGKFNFIINPRFMVPLTNSVSMKKPEDRSLIVIEDVFTGFQGIATSSADKKFNLFVRFGMRLPTSRLSRNSNNAGFGSISEQLEFTYNPTYDLSKKLQIGLMGTIRNWIYQQRYNYSRSRLYTAPYVQYSINDTTRFMFYYENMIENNKRWESINGKKPVFKDVLQNVLVGISKDLNQKFNVFPFAGFYVNDIPLSTESLWFGMWMSYKIK